MPKGRKKGEQGTPTVMVIYGEATPEQVQENRRSLEDTLSKIYSADLGFSVTATILCGEKPPRYGETRICHGDDVIFPSDMPFEELPDWAQEAVVSHERYKKNFPGLAQPTYSFPQVDDKIHFCDRLKQES